MVPDRTAADLEPGTRLGPYVIESLLGAGGMGQVYRALDERLNRPVAVKLLPAFFVADPDRLRRFELEARLASSLSHPNILVVYDVGRHEDSPFIVEELLEGQTLRDGLRGRFFAPHRAIGIARQISEGLAAAHAKGIVHRDLKPSNVFLCRDGPVKILDFGLAKLRAPHTLEGEPDTFSTTAGVLGTVGYLAPEQARGIHIDHRADIFGLGCVLYEMLTGRRAFTGATAAEMLAATLSKDPPSVSHASPDVPRSLARVVHRCLEKEPEDRFSSAHDLALALESTQEDVGRWRWWSGLRFSRRVWRALRLVPVVAALAGVAVVAWHRFTDRPLPEFNPRQVTSGAGLETQPAISPDGRDIAYTASRDGNTDIWLVDVAGGAQLRRTQDVAVDESPAWFPDGSALAFVSDRGGRRGIWKVDRLGGDPIPLLADARDPAISPDGQRIAFARPDSSGHTRIAVAPLDDPNDVRVLTTSEHGNLDHERPTWSPDGRTVCYQDFNKVWIVAAAGGTPRRLSEDEPVDIQPAWSPNGRFLYLSSIRRGIRAIWRRPLGRGESTRVTMGSGEQWPSLALDGRRLAYATVTHREALLVIDRSTGRRSRFQEARRMDSPTVAPDGSAVVFVSDRDGHANLWRLPLGEAALQREPQRVTGHSGRCSNPRLSPDGRWIAYVRKVDGNSDVWVVPATGGASRRFTTDPAKDAVPVWAPDGSQLAFISARDGSAQVWVAPVGDGARTGPSRTITQSPAPIDSFAWSPDGRQLAYVSRVEGIEEIWITAADGKGETRRLTEGATIDDVRWDGQSGRLLALGLWGERTQSLRTVDPESKALAPVPHGTTSGPFSEIQAFDTSADGRWLVLLEDDPTGDVWMLEASRGSF
jgi:Tol biopolymer transport system component